jgi:hypothetical protein
MAQALRPYICLRVKLCHEGANWRTERYHIIGDLELQVLIGDSGRMPILS